LYPGIEAYHSPRKNPCIAKKLEPVVLGDKDALFGALTKVLERLQHAGRPVLIIAASIQDASALTDHLKRVFPAQSEGGPCIECLNGVQEKDQDDVLSLAGNPGHILVATALAGRGADIKVNNSVKGGLHVIMCYLPQNERVEAQNAGRAGRQGQEGSYQMMVTERQIQNFTRNKSAVSFAAYLAHRKELQVHLCKDIEAQVLFNHCLFDTMQLAYLSGVDLEASGWFVRYNYLLDQLNLEGSTLHIEDFAGMCVSAIKGLTIFDEALACIETEAKQNSDVPSLLLASLRSHEKKPVVPAAPAPAGGAGGGVGAGAGAYAGAGAGAAAGGARASAYRGTLFSALPAAAPASVTYDVTVKGLAWVDETSNEGEILADIHMYVSLPKGFERYKRIINTIVAVKRYAEPYRGKGKGKGPARDSRGVGLTFRVEGGPVDEMILQRAFSALAQGVNEHRARISKSAADAHDTGKLAELKKYTPGEIIGVKKEMGLQMFGVVSQATGVAVAAQDAFAAVDQEHDQDDLQNQHVFVENHAEHNAYDPSFLEPGDYTFEKEPQQFAHVTWTKQLQRANCRVDPDMRVSPQGASRYAIMIAAVPVQDKEAASASSRAKKRPRM
jgi:hypothetical protein